MENFWFVFDLTSIESNSQVHRSRMQWWLSEAGVKGTVKEREDIGHWVQSYS